MSVTRLTVLKGLCRQPELTNHFVARLTRKTFEHQHEEKGRSAKPDTPTGRSHRQMMEDVLEGMTAWQRTPTAKLQGSCFMCEW